MPAVHGLMDAALNLLDRQVIDADGLMVCKVDDLELEAVDTADLRVTGLLAGPAALLPRLSGWLGESLLQAWGRLAPEQHQRSTPWRIDVDLVREVDYAVHLSARREGLLAKAARPAPGGLRFNHLLGMSVRCRGDQLGLVRDARLRPREGTEPFSCVSLVVGRDRAGSFLGYDRSPRMGPVLLQHAVRWLHRHTGQVDLEDVVHLDWQRRRIEVRGGLRELQDADAA